MRDESDAMDWQVIFLAKIAIERAQRMAKVTLAAAAPPPKRKRRKRVQPWSLPHG